MSSSGLEDPLRRAGRNLVKSCLNLKAGESFLVITDTETRAIGEAIFEEGLDVGAESMLLVMKPRSRHGEEPPKPLAEVWQHVDAFVAPTKYSLTHTQARRRATEAGARGATMPGITPEVFIKGLAIDYSLVKQNNERLLKPLEGAETVRVVTDLGTDLTFSVKGRTFIADSGILHERGAFGNLPAGEVFVAPLEGTGEGVLVIDGSMAGVGVLRRPVKVTIRSGFAEEFAGAEEAAKFKGLLKSAGLREAFNLAEFGIGTNPAAELVGNILMDEKVYGTVHVAFGDNSTIGGRVRAGIHLDGILRKPTVYVDGRVLMKDGRWLV
jgi:leucyl aminopeptidase (aminopeptidase T)